MLVRPAGPRFRHHVAVVLAAVLALGACADTTADRGDAAPGGGPLGQATTTSTAPAPDMAPTTSVPPTTTTTLPPPVLARDAQSLAVVALQSELARLGYWPGDIDGRFGLSTHHAVVAVQKVIGVAPTGIADDAVWEALRDDVRPTPRSTQGRVIEADVARQVLFVVEDGEVTHVFDTSTGRREGWTPLGEWEVERHIDGFRYAPLGTLYRPKYVVRGVAVHGYTDVPSHPASHGCLRVTYEAMDVIWDQDLMPIGTPFLIY